MDLLSTDACTLPTEDRPLRLAEFDDLFAEAVTAAEVRGTTATLTLAGPAGLVERVRDLTARESHCCSFFGFALAGTDDDLRLTITVPPERADLLSALVARATPPPTATT